MITADYIDHMGSDLTVVNAARVSFDKESDWEYADWEYTDCPMIRLQDRDFKLIHYLANHNHWTPFAHCQMTLRETVPIFVARQRFKHTVGFAYNEVSRRYVDDEPQFYVPDEFREKADNKKQGSGGNHPMSDLYRDDLIETHADLVSWYNSMIEDGIAPEQARMVLPQSMMTSYYVTGSLAAWARFYKLRADSHAQQEIQILAEQVRPHLEQRWPVSWAALVS